MNRAALIYNPKSGKELVLQHREAIIQAIEEAGFEVTPMETSPEPQSATKLARQAALDRYDLLIAAGGDGTIREVVNGFADLEKRPDLAIIPAGTTNDYARALGIPRGDLVEAAKLIQKGKKTPMDIGQFQDSYFINIAAGGSLTALTFEVSTETKSRLGYFAYVLEGAKRMMQLEPMELDIQFQDGSYKGPASMFFIALTNSIGGFESIIPDSQLTDGNFSILVIKTSNILEIVHLVNQMLLGGHHVDNEHVLYVKSPWVKVQTGQPLPINLDGENGGDTPAAIVNLQQHIQIYNDLDDLERVKKDRQTQEEALKQFSQEVDRIERGEYEEK